jgi:hypothetical protein
MGLHMLNHLISAFSILLFVSVSMRAALFGFSLADCTPLPSVPRDLLKGSLACALLMLCTWFIGAEVCIV